MAARLETKGLVILDRDGVINRDSREFVKNSHEWAPLPGSIEAIAALSKCGYTVAVASNQSGDLKCVPVYDNLAAVAADLVRD